MIADECLQTDLDFKQIAKIIYFGKSLKYYIPNTLLIVTNQENSKFVNYENTHTTYSNCLSKAVGNIWDKSNLEYWWASILIHTSIYNNFPLKEIVSEKWIYDTNPFKEGFELDLDFLNRIGKLSAFI